MKLYSFQNNNQPINYFSSSKQVEIPEFFVRKDICGIWITNVLNIDLPLANDESFYKSKVVELLDQCVTLSINTIFFQVRTTNDAFFKSKLNPFSRFLTGKEGVPPSFDIMKWVIDECKIRNISFHAWCNPYRVSANNALSIDDYLKTCDLHNFAKLHPEYLILDTTGKLILNPAKQAVKTFIIDSMKELADLYDIDGIHFDDYFYPYSGLSDSLNDLPDYELRENLALTLDEFRRDNVTDVIKGVRDMLKKHHPNISFGVSPFGIWRNKTSDLRGSNTASVCSESYSNQYADTYKWVKEGLIDYVIPQIYWEFSHPIAPFADILDWWVDLCENSNVDLYIGHALYRMGSKGAYENPFEIIHQLQYANQHKTVKGNVFFSAKSLLQDNTIINGLQEFNQLLSGRKL